MARYYIGRNNWHYPNPGTSQTGSYVSSGTIDIDVSGTTVTVTASITNNASYSRRDSQFHDKFHIFIGGKEVAVSGNYPTRGSATLSASGTRYDCTGTVTVEIKMQCGDFTDDCPNGLQSNSANWRNVFSQGVTVYQEYSLSIISVTNIGKVDRDTFTVVYNLNGGTDSIRTCELRIYENNNNRVATIGISGNKSGNNQSASFRPTTPTYKHGTYYTVSVYAYDGTTQIETNKLPFYTFQEPLLGDVSVEKPSPQNANTSNTFTLSGTNNKKWNDLELDFETHYRIIRPDGTTTDWLTIGNITSWPRTAEQMRALIPKTYDAQNNQIQFRRYSPRANWESTNQPSVTMMLYYRPRMAVDSNSVTYHRNSQSGNLINKGQIITNTTTLNSIYINWNYDTTLPEAGYVQGYRVRLYNYQNNLVKTYYTTNKYIEILKEDIPRLNMTYIDITPYFGNDTNNTSNYWYYNGTIEKIQFIRLVTELEKPQITYPVQNSIWINKDFRVCFKLPVDPDKGYETETYHYENIELKVNKIVYRLTTSNGTSSGSVDGSTIFSCLSNNLTYQRPVVIYPNLLNNVPNTDTYTIQVRVKKKYGTTSTEFRWSPWSDIRTFTVYFPTYEVQQYDLIMATHYNDAFDTVDNVRNTYGVSWTDKPLRAVAKSTIIMAEQYSYNTIMKKLVHTKNQVNTYATFDTNRDNIKFDYTNELPETFNERVGEFITADKNEGNEYNGRNYIKFIYDRCKLLK